MPGFAALVVVLVASRYFVDYPLWVSALIVLLWVAKDVIMFSLTGDAYVGDAQNNDQYAGLTAVAVEDLCPVGYVRVRGELWLAENTEHGSTVNSGQSVSVLERRGAILLVRPED